VSQQQAGKDLSVRMRERADADKLPADHELRTHADKLDAAVDGFFGQPQTMQVAQFVGTWARCRRAWCNYSGESLI